MSGSGSSRAELRDPTERVVDDDQGAHRAEEFRGNALLNQRLRALRLPVSQAGICANCGGRCLPLAVYCDPECRDDHEWRIGQQERQGTSR